MFSRISATAAVLVMAFALRGAEIAKVEGKDLPSVPGPLTGSPYLKDPLAAVTATPMELQMRGIARRVGYVPAVAVPGGDVVVTHAVDPMAGWMAFRVEAAPGETLKARLRGDHEGWYLMRCVNKWGQIEQGMLPNLIPTGNPEASYTNPRGEAYTVFFVVDTTMIPLPNEKFEVTFLRTRTVKAGKS